MLLGILLGVVICLGQDKAKPKPEKLPPPKVEITKFTPPKSKNPKAKPPKTKLTPPVIRKDS